MMPQGNYKSLFGREMIPQTPQGCLKKNLKKERRYQQNNSMTRISFDGKTTIKKLYTVYVLIKITIYSKTETIQQANHNHNSMREKIPRYNKSVTPKRMKNYR